MDRLTKEAKLKAVTDLASKYGAAGEKGEPHMNADEYCQLVKKLAETIDACYPEDSTQRVGLV